MGEASSAKVDDWQAFAATQPIQEVQDQMGRSRLHLPNTVFGGDPIIDVEPSCEPGDSSSLEEQRFSFLSHLPLTRKAAAFAEEHHRGQHRLGDNAAYMLHLFEVASLLDRSGYPDHVVAGAILHDVLEDTDASVDDLDAGSEGR